MKYGSQLSLGWYGLSPPPITVVGGCKAGGSESHGGSPTRPLAARLDRQAPGNRRGVASRSDELSDAP